MVAVGVASLALLHIALRLFFFSGFVLGDDASYAELVNQLLGKTIPRAVGTNVFASRPILLGLTAWSVGLFGWSEFAYVLPALLASLCCCLAATYVAHVLHGRSAAVFTGLLFAFFGFDMCRATTMSNDIIAAGLLAAGTATVVRGSRTGQCVPMVLGGMLAGLASGVKLLYIVSILPFGIAATVVAIRSPRARQALYWGLGGWAIAQLCLMLFFQVTTNDPLAHWHVESQFNSRYMMHGILADRGGVLQFYPRLMLGSLPGGTRLGYPGYIFSPYDGVFSIALIALVVGWRWCERRWALAVALSGITWFLILQFWPFTLWPDYCPIHRLDRTLSVVAVNALVLAAFGLSSLWRRGRIWRLVSTSIFALYVCVQGRTAVSVTRLERDFMQDMRAAVAPVKMAECSVYCDAELTGYLNFRTGFSKRATIRTFPDLPGQDEAALVIVGGTRRPEIDSEYSSRSFPVPVPGHWRRLFHLPGQLRPWRPFPGVILYTGNGGTGEPSQTDIVTIDVGDVLDELRHGYVVHGMTWAGMREFVDPRGGGLVSDRGRAFTGFQEMLVPVDAGTRALLAEKLIDAQVRNQHSEWLVNDEETRTLAEVPPAATPTWMWVRVLV